MHSIPLLLTRIYSIYLDITEFPEPRRLRGNTLQVAFPVWTTSPRGYINTPAAFWSIDVHVCHVRACGETSVGPSHVSETSEFRISFYIICLRSLSYLGDYSGNAEYINIKKRQQKSFFSKKTSIQIEIKCNEKSDLLSEVQMES